MYVVFLFLRFNEKVLPMIRSGFVTRVKLWTDLHGSDLSGILTLLLYYHSALSQSQVPTLLNTEEHSGYTAEGWGLWDIHIELFKKMREKTHTT